MVIMEDGMKANARAALATARRAMLIAITAASISNVAGGPAAAAGNACEPEILKAADRYGVPAGILYAVGLTETGKKGSLQPNALNIEGRAVFPSGRRQAVLKVEKARAEGAKLIDLGCMQINHHYHRQHFASLEDMLDPRRNVDYAARFLASLHARHESWSMAVARYHAGPDNDPAQKRYVCRVIANMVATGFGKWTPNASAFCNHR
jgi:soluble lytic murein transglycosylase-like protein